MSILGLSILAQSAAGPPLWVWIVWLVVGVAVGVAGLWRPRRGGEATDYVVHAPAEPPTDADVVAVSAVEYARPPARSLRPVPLLAVTGLVSFCAWVATQLVYVSVRQPSVDAGNGRLSWTAVDLARLSLLSAGVGWIVGFGLLYIGDGVRAVGYGLRRVPSGLLVGAIGIFVALPIVFFSLEATLHVWRMLQIDHPAKHELLQAIEDDPQNWVRVVAFVSAVVAAPLFEEMLFRGCVQGGLRRATGSPWAAIATASVLFAAIHPKWTIPPIFVFSILLGLVYERSRNLWATTVMHALFNLYAIYSSGMN